MQNMKLSRIKYVAKTQRERETRLTQLPQIRENLIVTHLQYRKSKKC